MDAQYQIQLGKNKSVDSINVDEYLTINIESPKSELMIYDQTSIIDVADLFNDERQASLNYRIYGDIDFMSLINGLKKTYTSVTDFFTRPRLGDEASGLTRNVLNTFDVYLCRLHTGHTSFSVTKYQTKYQILTSLSSFEIYNSGYAKNMFYDQKHSFDFNVDINIDGLYDGFGKPIMDLFLYFQIKPDLSKSETLRKKVFNSSSDESTSTSTGFTYTTYNAGDVINGDLVFYDERNFQEQTLNKMEYYINFPVENLDEDDIQLQFKYNPLVKIKLRDYSDSLVTANISGTSENDRLIPSYAVKIDDDGNYIWQDILPNGYIDPVSMIGVNHPFINMSHYVFSNIILKVIPNLNDATTATEFANMTFGPNALVYSKPITDLNNMGSKC